MGACPLSTDSAAWNSTRGMNCCPANQPPPLGDIRWGLAATAGALSWFHIDSNGYATYLDSKAGSKEIIIGRRKFGEDNFNSFSEVDIFLNGFETEDPNADRWDLEAMILPPGTRLQAPSYWHFLFVLIQT
jgi:hypothetical protein